jgi:hypothetical protein
MAGAMGQQEKPDVTVVTELSGDDNHVNLGALLAGGRQPWSG